MASSEGYTDIKFEIKGKIGIIKVHLYNQTIPLLPSFQSAHLSMLATFSNSFQFNRPKALNSFGGNIIADTIAAFRVLDNHPDTIFTVLTGEGRFFSAGADVKTGGLSDPVEYKNAAEKKLAFLQKFAYGTSPTYSPV
jgi:peroxisomal 3,2-trans-enoyl-CoA isomerase